MVEQLVRDSLTPLFDKELDSLILGCTHYPLLQTVIGHVMGSGVELISSAERTAVEVDEVLSRQKLYTTEERAGSAVFYTTGDGRRMRAFLANWLHIAESEAVIRRVLPATLAVTPSQSGL
jgi:glutamate racemase